MSVRPVITTTLHSHYLLSALIACWLWAEHQPDCKPILFVCHDDGDPLITSADAPLRTHIAAANCQTSFVPTIAGLQACTIAQVSRLYAAHFAQVEDADVLLTTDADMLPVNHYVANIARYCPRGAFHTIGYDAYRPQRRLPMCYIAAAATTWRTHFRAGSPDLVHCCQDTVRAVTGSGENVERWRGWDVDEVYAGEVILALDAGLVEHAPRHFAAGGLADGRMDRANSGESWERRDSAIDAHLPRPLGDPDAWAKTERLLRGFGGDVWSRAASMRAELLAILGGRHALI